MILDKLSEEQRVAVKQPGHVLLTACPGSGKTRVIIHKLAYEISKLEPASKRRAVAVTFTIRASEEIMRRLDGLGIDKSRIWSGTLHSFCLEWIVKPYAMYLPELKAGFRIADAAHCDEMISALKEAYGLKQIDSINMRYTRDGAFAETEPVRVKILIEYRNALVSGKQIDFEMILHYSFKLLSAYPKIAKTLSNLFSLVCVDEYQDTQDLLYGIICSIVNAGNGSTSLFLVGDSDQAIYASLGGVAKSYEQIKSEINNSDLTLLTLSGNYRSSQKVIDYYKAFQMQEVPIIALGSNAKDDGMITLNSTLKKDEVVSEIAKLIKHSLSSGIPESEICVLVPQWWLVTSVSKKLRSLLPDVNFDASGLAPMSRNRDNIWYKLSRLFLTNPHPKIYSLRYRWAEELIEEFESYTNSDFHPRYRSGRSFLALVNSIKSAATEGIDYLEDCFSQFLSAVKIVFEDYPPLVDNRKTFFDTIYSRISDPDFQIPSDVESFKSFYREMTGIVINTCVGVKGEEFETVIAYGLLHGYVPHWNEIFNPDAAVAVSASKKLLYVICSRAKTNLHLISEVGRVTAKGKALSINQQLGAISYPYDSLPAPSE